MTIDTRSMLPFRVATLVVTLAASFLWIAYPHGAQAVAVDRGSRDYTLPAQMQWKDIENGSIAHAEFIIPTVHNMLAIERVIDAVAWQLGLDPLDPCRFHFGPHPRRGKRYLLSVQQRLLLAREIAEEHALISGDLGRHNRLGGKRLSQPLPRP